MDFTSITSCKAKSLDVFCSLELQDYTSTKNVGIKQACASTDDEKKVRNSQFAVYAFV